MDFNLLTTVLTTFVNALAAGQARVQSTGTGVLRSLAIIEIVLAGLWMAMDAPSLAAPFKKLLQISFWVWFANNFGTLTKKLCDSLVQLGLSAGGISGNLSLLLDPSRIAGQALDATQPLVQSMQDAGLTHFGDAMVLGLCFIVIMACFFIMACQVCLAVVEYYLIVTLAICLIPFGISAHTKFLAEKAIGAVVAVSVKLMVLAFIIGLIQPVLGQIKFSGTGEIKLNEVMAMVLVCGLLAVIVWRAPSFASDLLAASPSLSAGVVGQNVASGVSTTAGAVTGAASGVVGAAGLAATAFKSGGRGIIGGAAAAARILSSAATAGARKEGSSSAAAPPRAGSTKGGGSDTPRE